MSFRMRINSENPNRNVSEHIPIPIPIPTPTEKPTLVDSYKPIIDQNGRPVLNSSTNKYFTGSKQPTKSYTKPSESPEQIKNDTFTVENDTVVYDQNSGLWKI